MATKGRLTSRPADFAQTEGPSMPMIAASDICPEPTRLVSIYAGSFYEQADRTVHRYGLTLPGPFGVFTRRGDDGGRSGTRPNR
jgi:hypothetical protein